MTLGGPSTGPPRRYQEALTSPEVVRLIGVIFPVWIGVEIPYNVMEYFRPEIKLRKYLH